jgi:hypothetical protein
MREGTTSRVTAADRPYGEFYDFYSVSPENFGSTLIQGDKLNEGNSKNNSKQNPIHNFPFRNLYFYTSNSIFIVILF